MPLDYDRQIPKKSDQRQMEPWQRLGCYAAGLALDAAGAKADAALKSRMHLIVAAGGGERDYAVDGQILTRHPRRPPIPGVFLNERLMGDLRPTLFLAQLSNLLAGNISIVHGVTGASRTFMGEEQCGLDALRIAHARIASGQTDIFLVGGSYNAERPTCFSIYELGGFLWKGPFASVWDRPAKGGGFILGSGGAFLVMEAREHADARGATPLAAVAGIAADRTKRRPGDVAASLERLWKEVGAGADTAVLSGATGVNGHHRGGASGARQADAGAAARARRSDRSYHGAADSRPASCSAPPPSPAARRGEAVVTSVGHKRGEGLVRLVAPA